MQSGVIQVNLVSKSYKIGANKELYSGLREALSSLPQRILRRGRTLPDGGSEGKSGRFWALKDVSFSVRTGEVVGLIGHNGAGKSTLLKILSRITEPTEGRVALRGRVGSLLEVGTGFHPELTGRENIYLSGAILGMRRTEVARNFDEIVDFSGVERFIDTPIKRYSSGMNVRLGFAVAAHLQSEILLIDEVLAVGDAEFQQKCLGKMGEVARGGRTIVFVSHNLGAIQALCSRAVVINDGRLVADTDAGRAVERYLGLLEKRSSYDGSTLSRSGEGSIRIESVDIVPGGGTSLLATGKPAMVTIALSKMVSDLSCKFTVYNSLGQAIATFDSAERSLREAKAEANARRLRCTIDELTLLPGRYRINVRLIAGGLVQDHITSACTFDVAGGIVEGRSVTEAPGRQANVYMHHHWQAG